MPSTDKDILDKIAWLIPDLPTVDQITPYLSAMVKAKWYTNFGPTHDAYRQKLIETFFPKLDATQHIALLNNGTMAMELALKALHLPRNGKVLVPALTFPATALAVINAGLVPVLSDIDPHCWQMTADIAEKICQKTSIDAVMPVSAFGQAVCVASWQAFHHKTGLPVIVDAAPALGTQALGEGLTLCFSLHATKYYGVGEGGLVVSENADLISQVVELANFGMREGKVCALGNNGKISEFHCAVGLAQLHRKTVIDQVRRDCWRHYLNHLIEPVTKELAGRAPAYLVGTIENPAVAQVQSHLANHHIETRRLYWPLLASHPALKPPRVENRVQLAQTKDISDRLLALPFHNNLSEAQIVKVAALIKKVSNFSLYQCPS